MKRICFVVTSEYAIKVFLLNHLRALANHYDVTAVANTSDPASLRRFGLSTDLTPVAIERKVSLLRDLKALFALWRLFRAHRFVAVHSITPKAGLLTMLAGAAAGIPVRLHTFTGQVWATRSGLARQILKAADRITAMSATHVLADSGSQKAFLVAEGVVPPQKVRVLGSGSISGVDLQRFHPDPEARRRIRAELDIPEEAVVFLFLGRVTREKGLFDLAEAFSDMASRHPHAYLLVVGPDEEQLAAPLLASLRSVAKRVRILDFTDRPNQLMAASDVYCLPSYREGFGTAVIEAAATGLPAIASRIYGLTDSVEDGVTGFLHPARDTTEIARLLSQFADDEALRREMGLRARRRAEQLFSADALSREVVQLYADLLSERGTVAR